MSGFGTTVGGSMLSEEAEDMSALTLEPSLLGLDSEDGKVIVEADRDADDDDDDDEDAAGKKRQAGSDDEDDDLADDDEDEDEKPATVRSDVEHWTKLKIKSRAQHCIAHVRILTHSTAYFTLLSHPNPLLLYGSQTSQQLSRFPTNSSLKNPQS